MDEPINQVAQLSLVKGTPLSDEESTLLEQCEMTIAEGLSEFIRVGEALMKIAHKGLYRTTHSTFEEYCRDRWGLARRTAYQKIKAAETYENVRNCAHFPPQNEYQTLQLVPLTKELQQIAWQKVVADQETIHRALTARNVREVVRTVQASQKGTTLPDRLRADRTFPGIPWFWQIGRLKSDTDTNKQHLSLLPLPPVAPQDDTTSSMRPYTQLVLVSPDIDIFFPWKLSPTYQHKLIALLESVPQRHFLFWTDRPDRYPAIPWPPNVELAMRVSCQADWSRFNALTPNAVHIQTLWLVPEERLSLPSPLPFTRVLIGNAHWAPGHTSEEITALRQLVGLLLTESPAVHLATAMQQLIYRYPGG
ncbi:MAG: hypothetical protein ACYDBB_10555 [Armatimonadota bacterium]